MVEISLSGSGEGRGPVTGRGYSTEGYRFWPPGSDKRFAIRRPGLRQVDRDLALRPFTPRHAAPPPGMLPQ